MVILWLNAVKSLQYHKGQLIGFIGNIMLLELQVEIAADRVGRNVKINSRLAEHFSIDIDFFLVQ